MKLKHYKKHLLAVFDFEETKEKSFLCQRLVLLFFHLQSLILLIFFVFSEILNMLCKILFRIVVVFPITLGTFLLKCLFYLIFKCLKEIFEKSTRFFLNLIMNFLKINFLIFYFIIFICIKKLPKNEDLKLGTNFWFSSVPRSNNLELDFVEYNRKFSRLYFRKIFKPTKILVDENLLNEKLYEFKISLFSNNLKYIDFYFFRQRRQFPGNMKGTISGLHQVNNLNLLYNSDYPFERILRLMFDEKDFEFLGKKLLNLNFFNLFTPYFFPFFNYSSIANQQTLKFDHLIGNKKFNYDRYYMFRYLSNSFLYDKILNYDPFLFVSFIGLSLQKNINFQQPLMLKSSLKDENMLILNIDDLWYASMKHQYFTDVDLWGEGGFLDSAQPEDVDNDIDDYTDPGDDLMSELATTFEEEGFEEEELGDVQSSYNPYFFSIYGADNIIKNAFAAENQTDAMPLFFFGNIVNWPVLDNIDEELDSSNEEFDSITEQDRFFSLISDSEFNSLYNDWESDHDLDFELENAVGGVETVDIYDDDEFEEDYDDDEELDAFVFVYSDFLTSFFGRTFPFSFSGFDEDNRFNNLSFEYNEFFNDLLFDKRKLIELSHLINLSKKYSFENFALRFNKLKKFKSVKNEQIFNKNFFIDNNFRKDEWIQDLLLKYNKMFLLSNIPPIKNSFKFPKTLTQVKEEAMISDLNDVNPQHLHFTTEKAPFADSEYKYPARTKTLNSIWDLSLGKYNHELIWKSRSLNPFLLAPTKKRMTTGDFWFLRRGFAAGVLSINEIYYILKNSKIIKFLRNIENKICFFIFNVLPTEFILIELKYFLLNSILDFSLFDQLLINLSNLFSYDFLEFKWFLVRLLIIISDVFLWYMFAYVKVTLVVLVNICFDDVVSNYMYISKVLNNFYYIDAFIPLNKRDFYRWKYQFLEFWNTDVVEDDDEIGYYDRYLRGTILSKRYIEKSKYTRGTRLKLRRTFLLPERHFGSGCFGKEDDINRFSSMIRSFFSLLYDLRRYPYESRRGNTIVFGIGGKFRALNRKEDSFFLEYRTIMRFNNEMPFRFHLRHFSYYFPTEVTYKYTLLNFSNYFGLKFQNYNNYTNLNLLLLENTFTLYPVWLEVFNSSNNNVNFLEFFNSSLRPVQISEFFKHFYFFNYVRPYKIMDPIVEDIFEFNPHHLSSEGLYKIPKFSSFSSGDFVLNPIFLNFKLPFFDFLSVPNVDLFGVNRSNDKMRSPFKKFYYIKRRWLADKRLLLLNAFNHYTYTKMFGFYVPLDENNNYIYTIASQKNLFDQIFSIKVLKSVSKIIYNSFIFSEIKSSIEFKGPIYGYESPTNPFFTQRFLNSRYNMRSPRFLDFFFRFESLFNFTITSNFDRMTKNYSDFHNSIYVSGLSPFSGLYTMFQYFTLMPSTIDDYNFYYNFLYSVDWPFKDVPYSIFDSRFCDVIDSAEFFDNLFLINSGYIFFNQVDYFSANLSDYKHLLGITNSYEETLLKYSDFFNYTFTTDDNIHPTLNKVIDYDEVLYDRDDKNKYFVILESDEIKDKQYRSFRIKVFKTQKMYFLLYILFLTILKCFFFLGYLIFNYKFYIVTLYFFILVILIFLNSIRLAIKQYLFLFKLLVLVFARSQKLFETDIVAKNNIYVIAKKLFPIEIETDFDNFQLPKFLNPFKIGFEYAYFRNFLIFNFIFEIPRFIYFNFVVQLISVFFYLFGLLNNFINSYFTLHIIFIKKLKKNLTNFFIFCIKDFSLTDIQMFFYKNAILLIKKLFFILSLRFWLYIFRRLIYYFSKIIHFMFFCLCFVLFIFLLRKYLIIYDLYITQIGGFSLCLMFFFILFFIWFLRIISKKFVENFLDSKFPIDPFLQNESFDPHGAISIDDYNFVEESDYEPDLYFDADSFLTYNLGHYDINENDLLKQCLNYVLFNLKNYLISKRRNAHMYKRLALRKDARRPIHQLPVANFLVLRFHLDQIRWNLDSYAPYKFNNDFANFYEYEESLKTLINLTTNVNFRKNNKLLSFQKHDLPWDSISYHNTLTKLFYYYSYALKYEKIVDNQTPGRVEYLADTNADTFESSLMPENYEKFPAMLGEFSHGLFEDEDVDYYQDENPFDYETIDINNYDISEEYSFKKFFSNYDTVAFNNKMEVDNLTNFIFSIDQEDYATILNNSKWLNEILVDRFLIDIINEDFFISFNDLIWKDFNKNVQDLDLKKSVDDHLLLTLNNEFRNYFINLFMKFRPVSIYKNTIYSVILNSLYRAKNITIAINSQPILGTELYKDNKNEALEFTSLIFHPRDVFFKLNKRIAIANYTPYSNNILNNEFKIVSIPIENYQFMNNFFKYVFFQDAKFFSNLLKLQNYPDLNINDAERLWIFLGCDQAFWNKSTFKFKNLSTFDSWEIPLFLSCFLFFTHYYRNNRFRIYKKAREGYYPIDFFSLMSVLEAEKYTHGIGASKYKQIRYRDLTKQPFFYFVPKRVPTYESSPFEFFWLIIDSFQNLIFSSKSFFNVRNAIFSFFAYDTFFFTFECIFFMFFSFFFDDFFFFNYNVFFSFVFNFFISYFYFILNYFLNINFFNFFLILINSFFFNSFFFHFTIFIIFIFIIFSNLFYLLFFKFNILFIYFLFIFKIFLLSFIMFFLFYLFLPFKFFFVLFFFFYYIYFFLTKKK